MGPIGPALDKDCFSMRLRLFLGALLVISLAAPTAVAAVGDADYEPITDEAYVSDLQELGYRNGDMPSVRMIELGSCLMERDAGYTLSLMIEAAGIDGVGLYTNDCYRSYGAQASAYDRRCPIEEEEVTREDPATGETTVVTVNKVRVCKGPPIARPGHSNHGYGRAVDFSSGYRTLTCQDAAFAWLQENAGRFGWVHPDWAHCGRVTQEPWHWEWGGVAEAIPLPPVPLSRPYNSPGRVS